VSGKNSLSALQAQNISMGKSSSSSMKARFPAGRNG
jgi:hypothetical protein